VTPLPSAERRHAFYEQHKLLTIVLILVLFLGPVLGLYFFGFPGLLSGVMLPAVAYVVLPVLFPPRTGR
jgi:hypothetical protein